MIEFNRDDVLVHFEHTHPKEGTLPEANDENCNICVKLKRLARFVPELKKLLDRTKKKKLE